MSLINNYEDVAKNLYDAGYRERGLLDQATSVQSEAEVMQEFYNEKYKKPYEDKISREDAEYILKEYQKNEKQWSAESDTESGGVSGGIAFVLVCALFAIVRYVKVLIATYKKAKIVDCMNRRDNDSEMEEKCNYYREALSDLKTCPKDIKAVAGTTPWMSVAGILCILLGAFNFLSMFNTYRGWIGDNRCESDLIILCILLVFMGVVFGVRHRLSAAILMVIETLLIARHVIIPYSGLFKPYALGGAGVGELLADPRYVGVTLILIGFVVFGVVSALYLLCNKKSKVFEGILFVAYCGAFIYMKIDYRLYHVINQTEKVARSGAVSRQLLEFFALFFIILLFMGKGKITSEKK